MTRRHLLALAALAAPLLLAGSAAADLAPSPPPLLSIQGQRSTVTSDGPPTHARYVLVNESPLPMEVFLDRVIQIDGRYRLPLTITQVQRGDGAALGRRFTVPANGRIEAVVFFDRCSGSGPTWELTLRAMTEGRRIEGTATVSRAHRDPARKHARAK